MNNFFECKVSYEKRNERGEKNRATELYLVDALSFSEAEARIVKETEPFVFGEFAIASIKRANYGEIVPENPIVNFVDAETRRMFGENKNASEAENKWFDCKVNYIRLDQKSGTEKKTAEHVLVRSSSLNAAHDTLCGHMRKTLCDYEIECIKETKIMDVFFYDSKS